MNTDGASDSPAVQPPPLTAFARFRARPFWQRMLVGGIGLTALLHSGIVFSSMLQTTGLPLRPEILFIFLFLSICVWGLAVLPALAGVLLGPIIMLLRRHRGDGFAILIVAATYIASSLLAGQIVGNHRTASFTKLAVRSAPLVAAIHRYYDDHGKPPLQLIQLVPEYIDAIPGTRMSGYPDYSYSSVHLHVDAEGNPWELWVNTPFGPIDFDRFVYFPN